MKSYTASPSTVERKWYVIDATGHTLGRLATEAAMILSGKKKPIYTPSFDTGDYVVIINADKIQVTGKKLEKKTYYTHSAYIGSGKETTLKEMLAKKPEEVLKHAIKGMLPKGSLGAQMFSKLHVYAGPEHKQAAQKPEAYDFVEKQY